MARDSKTQRCVNISFLIILFSIEVQFTVIDRGLILHRDNSGGGPSAKLMEIGLDVWTRTGVEFEE